MSLQKAVKQDNPHAVFVNNQGWLFLVLKTYQKPSKETSGSYARWFVAVESPFTRGRFELGDSYVADVLSGAELVAATQEWVQAYGLDPIETPRQWFFANDVDPNR